MRARDAVRWGLPTLAAFLGGMVVGTHRVAEATPEGQTPYSAVGQLGRVLVQIENHYVDPVEREKLVEGAIAGMVSNLDPHSAYMSPEEWKQFQSDTEGKFGGVGIEVDGRGDKLLVIAPIEGSPAHRAGVQSGDVIIGVDGDDVTGQALEKIIKRMRGAAGTKIKLTIRRGGVKEPIHFELTREVIKVSSVLYKLLDGGVAYLRIKQFQDRTHSEMLLAIAKLRADAKGAPLLGVLLDLRSNPGGLVDESADIADEFLSSGGIYSMRHRGQIIEQVNARSGGTFTDVPVVALVNEWSASASELLVGALQDNKRATVVGANTFGKGSVQSILPLPHGAGMRLTTARYYTPSGHAIQADGIHPDVLIESGTKGPGELKVLRERDLPGHLAAEGPEGGNVPRADAGALVEVADAGAPDGGEVSGQIARTIPADPSTSPDIALRVGYQLLRSKISGEKR